jgi:hypothetical protein
MQVVICGLILRKFHKYLEQWPESGVMHKPEDILLLLSDANNKLLFNGVYF